MSPRESYDEYAAIRAVNWGTLKELAKSPKHYRHRLATPRTDNPAMAFGRAVHSAVLEPDRFPVEFTVYTNGDRRGNEWKEFAAANADKTILKTAEYEKALAVRDAVRGHKRARQLLRRGKAEQSIVWIDPQTRIRCKARLDFVGPLGMFDLKTTGDIDQRIFGGVVARMNYVGQLAFYSNGLRALGIDRPVYIIAVEAEAPHDVAVFPVDEDTLDMGRDQVYELLHLLAGCRKRRSWPGQCPREAPLWLPSWAYPIPSDEIEIEVLSS
jgi:exodeoxyribonuclease VIII